MLVDIESNASKTSQYWPDIQLTFDMREKQYLGLMLKCSSVMFVIEHFTKKYLLV